jgi:uncharacterized protein (DUF1800 family)
MNRRSFLTGWAARVAPVSAPDADRLVRAASATLEPYVPDTTAPWDATRIGHLLRRTTFLPRHADIAALQALTPSAAVDLLLATPYEPSQPGVAESITESLSGLDQSLRAAVQARWRGDAGTLRAWQSTVMRDAPLSIAEKMTAFWSNHFATEFKVDDDYVIAPLLYRQNRLFRRTGLGSFRTLVANVTLDGAMLVYLGGHLNTAGKPNENYAREMLELFTTGLGHYTEGDIKEAARILTGWRVAQFNDEPAPNGNFTPYFDPPSHDVNAKQFLGVSFPARDSSTNTEFLVRRDEVERMIGVIFDRRAQACAEFICSKLYRFFVYSNPTASDRTVITAMAELLIASNWEIAPVMSALLNSAHFFDNANIGSQIKTPAEFEIGLARQLGATRSYADDMSKLGQELFDPPTVAGWPGYHEWITTTTFPVRAEIAQSVIAALDEDSLLAFIRSFPNHTDAAALVTAVGSVMLPRPMSPERSRSLRSLLVGGGMDYEWAQILSSSPSTAARTMREVLATIAQLPDFQLC